MIYRKKPSRSHNRRGVAVVEFAVCLPVIILVVLGSIEAANLLFLKQSMVQASYEGAKVAIRGGDRATIERAVRAVTDGRNITGLVIEFTPANPADAEPGEIIGIRTSAPGNPNSSLPFGPFANINVAASAVMIRE